MKNLFTYVLLLITLNALAQERLKVTYENQMQVEFEDDDIIVGGDKKAEFKKALKAAMEEIHTYELKLIGNEANFKKLEKIDNAPKEDGLSISFSTGGIGMNYFDYGEGVKMRETPNFNGQYIIQDNLEKIDWQLTREKDKILNYDVRKATAIIDSTTLVTAWYAPEIPIKAGPEEFWGLPGLILKVESVKGLEKESQKVYYSAIQIEMLPENEIIEQPTNGKMITEDEFSEMNRKQFERFKEMQGQGVDVSD